MTIAQFARLPTVAKQLAIRDVLKAATEIAIATNTQTGDALWATIPNEEPMEV